jgi:hypothetical protein
MKTYLDDILQSSTRVSDPLLTGSERTITGSHVKAVIVCGER